jgi:gas vesicle protein
VKTATLKAKRFWNSQEEKEQIDMDRDGLANFFLGLGIGVGLGILFAPKSGEETRDMLLNKADDGKEYLKKQSVVWKDQASDLASDLVDKGKEVLNRQKDNLSDAVEAGKQAYREKVEPVLPSEARG